MQESFLVDKTEETDHLLFPQGHAKILLSER
jgi:hypothetical protein